MKAHPYFIGKFGIPPSLQKGVRLERFVKALLNSPFFATMNKAGYSFDRAAFVRSVDLVS
jgi:hypothetical protein